MKRYSNINVYDAAKKRIEYIFDEFETIAVSFSGGKDSGVVLNMAVDEARKSGKRFTVIFIDLEAFYKVTIEYVEKMISNNRDVLDPLWICLPMESPNALSYFSPTWTWWEEGKEDIWVREMPKNEWVINLSNHKFEFYKPGMSFEKFTPLLNEWLAKTGSAAILLGLRAEESLNRYRAINDNKSTYKGLQWSTQINKAYSFSPIYDWTVEDIWTYNGKFRKEYNKLYDLFYQAGASIHKMRVDEPFGNEAKAGLNLFRVIEPNTWAKVANRVSGANFGNIYSGNKIMSTKYTLPEGHSWESFTKFLLETLPEDLANHYKRKFIKFKKVIDASPNIDTEDDVLTWRRMALCIIKNDYTCKGLSFSVTKDMSERGKYLVEKYRGL